MKNDTQHLEFLISQYVDGTLDGANKKFVDGELAGNPQARALVKDQRDVQEMLEDWGSRIPLIDWNEFDQKLAARLDAEAVAEKKTHAFRRWTRPMAAAAALFLAAGIGYAWHAWTLPAAPVGGGAGVAQQSAGGPEGIVTVDRPGQTGSYRAVQVGEVPSTEAGSVQVAVDPKNSGSVAGPKVAGTPAGSATAGGPALPATTDGLH